MSEKSKYSIEELEFKANENDIQSIVRLAHYYEVGEIVDKSEEKASYFYEKAAELGHPESQLYIANRYMTGNGVEQNDDKHIYWIKKSANNNNPEAQAALGGAYKDGAYGLKQDYETALALFKKSAAQGNRFGQFYLGVVYEKGRGVKKDIELAIDWYKKAANQDSIDALTNLGIIYCYGAENVSINTPNALKYLLKGVELGYSESQFQLGLMYDNGLGVEPNYDKAYELYKKAADQGHGGALNNINYLITIKKYSPQDQNQKTSLQLIQEAANYGVLESQHSLARKYFFGEDINKDIDMALYWYEKAANKGFVPSQQKLGLLYYKGDFVDKNDYIAYKWLNKSAEGDPDILSLVAEMLYKGIGTEKNLTRAFKYYLKSAELGNKLSQNKLGIIYAEGVLVEKNLGEAEKWFLRAANAGYEEAQDNLKILEKIRKTMVSPKTSLNHEEIMNVPNIAQESGMNIEKCPNCYNTEPFSTILKCSDCGKIFCTTCFNREPRGSFARCGEGSFPCSETACEGCGRDIGMIMP